MLLGLLAGMEQNLDYRGAGCVLRLDRRRSRRWERFHRLVYQFLVLECEEMPETHVALGHD